MATKLNIPTPRDDPATSLGRWLWEVVCRIEDNPQAAKFRDYALPLLFLKRLNDVYDDEIRDITKEVGDHATAQRLLDSDHGLVRFFIPPDARWPRVSTLTKGLGEALTSAMRAVAKANPRTQGVIDAVDYNAMSAGKRIIDDQRLTTIIGALSDPEHRLGLVDAPGETFGTAFEDLLRRYAEGRSEGAGEAYTPPTVAQLMIALLDPKPGMSVYDPCCGSGGLLVGCQLYLLRTLGTAKRTRTVTVKCGSTCPHWSRALAFHLLRGIHERHSARCRRATLPRRHDDATIDAGCLWAAPSIRPGDDRSTMEPAVS